jgi:hypothetical protein
MSDIPSHHVREFRPVGSYDQHCEDLAAEFLEDNQEIDTPANRVALAQEIQDVIESFLTEKLDLEADKRL